MLQNSIYLMYVYLSVKISKSENMTISLLNFIFPYIENILKILVMKERKSVNMYDAVKILVKINIKFSLLGASFFDKRKRIFINIKL